MYSVNLLNTKNALLEKSYVREAASMQKKVSSLIQEKQKISLSLAISLAQNSKIIDDIVNKNISKEYYKELILKLSQSAQYQNIWLELFDENLTPVYKSWSENSDSDVVCNSLKVELQEVLKKKAPKSSINSGIHTLGLRSLVPIYKNDKNIGALELITHFNSISAELSKSDISSVVVLNKKQSSIILKPFTDIFIDDYYIANFDASAVLIEYLKTNGIENFLNSSYRTKDNYLITAYELRDTKNNSIGYYVMFKNLRSIDVGDINLLMFKKVLIFIIIILVVLILFIIFSYLRSSKESRFYKKMVNSSPNIVLVVTKDEIVEANITFFKYFNEFKTLQDFKKRYKSISELFAKENGYICKISDHFCWIEHIIKNPNDNKIKLIYNESAFYFSVGVSLISEDDGLYSVIFRDITREEVYKKELEETNITDTLTKVKNRYYYNLQIKKECTNANRYFYPLSLIIFDVDYFKKVNDIHGHDVGDKVLVEYTRLIGIHLRDSDIFCRIGGEEFALILPHTSKAGAYKLADKLRIIVQEHKIVLPITMSFGVVEYKKGEDLEFTFKRADEALYEAKHNGRNRVVVR